MSNIAESPHTLLTYLPSYTRSASIYKSIHIHNLTIANKQKKHCTVANPSLSFSPTPTIFFA